LREDAGHEEPAAPGGVEDLVRINKARGIHEHNLLWKNISFLETKYGTV
jgi:hypothetical protein